MQQANDETGQQHPQQSQQHHHSQRRKNSATKPLTDAEKGAINANYAYLGKEPPFTVGNWRGRWSGRGRGRARGRGRVRQGEREMRGTATRRGTQP